MKKIRIQNQIISVNLSDIGDDYLSLTDLAKFKDVKFPARVINNWMRNKNTIGFIGIWEKINNIDFKLLEFEQFKKESGSNNFFISPDKWIKLTNATGIRSSSGRYGGTFVHKDIAFEFAMWINPEFKLFLIKEFQRLKNEEGEVKNLDWNVKRALTKINYKIHTNSIKENIVIPHKIKNPNLTYASEADVLNIALFGITAKDWKLNNKDLEGNMRDYSDISQLICLSNLEVLNSEFIKSRLTQKERLIKLNEIAISQMRLLASNNTIKKLV
ncbi:KilA-N domain-containing protein [Arenimonas sp.]|nr:KilA-N domain-containing protein [Candidatus Parcubacteria bacterium]